MADPAGFLADTIAAPASAPGIAIRAIIRISGPDARSALASIGCTPMPVARGCSRVTVQFPHPDEQREPTVLPSLLNWFPSPASYTGEDSAELLYCGNPHLGTRVLHALFNRATVRPAQPGEFTARAFLRGRLSLDQAEGVAAIIAARTTEQLDAARNLLSGSQGAAYRLWAEEVTALLALVEAGIDFTDQEDVVAIDAHSLAQRASALAATLQTHASLAHHGATLNAMPVVALAGRPNAGKSTLFNALLEKDRAITSPVAGTTRDVIEEPLDLSFSVPGAGEVLLCDSAGVDNATSDGCTASAAQAAAASSLAHADLIVWCDPSGRFEAHERAALGVPVGTPVLAVRTFADVPVVGGQENAIPVCALDHWNLTPLKRAIADGATASRAAGIAAILPRHRRAIAAAAAALHEATLVAKASGGERLTEPEVAARGLRDALDALGELVGSVSPDDVIGRIFSTFCVGK